jgi:hypothetical protein
MSFQAWPTKGAPHAETILQWSGEPVVCRIERVSAGNAIIDAQPVAQLRYERIDNSCRALVGGDVTKVGKANGMAIAVYLKRAGQIYPASGIRVGVRYLGNP